MRGAYLVFRPVPLRLSERVSPGMSLVQVQSEAHRLNVAWRVDEPSLIDASAPGTASGEHVCPHIICHQADAGLQCENFQNAKSFGLYWNSYACNIMLRNDVVDRVWAYQDERTSSCDRVRTSVGEKTTG